MFKIIGVSILAVLIGMFGTVIGRSLLIGKTAIAIQDPVDPLEFDDAVVAERLAGAIKIQTVSHAIGTLSSRNVFLDFHRYLEQNFPKAHAAMEREIINKYSLLYTWQGEDPAKAPVLISAHIDVVPIEPGTEADWTYPPFSGEIADGYIWGRGALDMKQSLMGVLEAVETLLGQGFTPDRTIILAFGHDEEVSGEQGAGAIAALLKERGIAPEFVLDEGSVIAKGIIPGVDRPTAIIDATEKGIGQIEMIAKAPGGHSARPPRENAIAMLGTALSELQDHPMPARLQSPVSDMFADLAPEMPFVNRLILTNRWLFEPLLLEKLGRLPATNASIRSTITPTIIDSGVKANVVPQRASTILSLRLLPGDTSDDIVNHIFEVTGAVLDDNRSNGIDCEPVPCLAFGFGVKRVWEAAPVSDVNSDGYRAISNAVSQSSPDVAIVPGMVLGITDSRHYREIAQNIYRFIPMRLERDDLTRIHGTNERISIENYAEIIQFYGVLLRGLGDNYRLAAP